MSPAFALSLTAAAVLLAFFARDRRTIASCALIFAANELAYLWAWAPMSPHHIIRVLTGTRIPSSELWAVGDCWAGLAIVMTLMDAGCMRLAGTFLNLYLGQIACYIAMQETPPADPRDVLWLVLDYCFYAMIAIFAVLGGGGVVDLVIRLSARRRRAVSHRFAFLSPSFRKVDLAGEVEAPLPFGGAPINETRG